MCVSAVFCEMTANKLELLALADTLRSEFFLYDIDVHICFICSTQTPGFEEEQKLKPAVTKKLEEADSILSTDEVVSKILKGALMGTLSTF